MGNHDITSIGSKVTLITALFPDGIVFSEASDEVAIWDIKCTPFGETTAGANNDQINHKMPSVYTITIGLIPNSQSDLNMKKITAWNRPNGSTVNIDFIQGVLVEPSGNKSIFPNLNMTEGALANSPTTTGKFAANIYVFKGVNQAY